MWSGNIDYPFDDFARHFEAWNSSIRSLTHVTRRTGSTIELGDDRSFEANVMRICHYFDQQYPPDTAMELGSLFGQMMSFLSQHMPDFDVGTLAVQARVQSLVSEKLLRAVHHAFLTMTPDEWRGSGPSIERIKDLAETQFASFE